MSTLKFTSTSSVASRPSIVRKTNVISLGLAQSDFIKWRLLYN
jgi:hypothetical protein